MTDRGSVLHLGYQERPKGSFYISAEDVATKKLALLGMSGSGKTYGLGDILEEMYKSRIPWIAFDPANNLWGLRCKKDGSPSGYEIVIIGGDHADIPLEKDSGQRIAEALLAEPICAVIDLAFESKNVLRKFITDFCNTLMAHRVEIPRHVIIEEAPELVPQKAKYPAMQECKAAVDKLVRIGGNFGYGVTLASQRSATIDKDVLWQCESLIALRVTGKRDRDAIRDWIEAKNIGDKVRKCFEGLGALKDGEAWYWSPTDDRFEKFRFRERETLHPRDMRKTGVKSRNLALSNVGPFVERLKKQLNKTVVVQIAGVERRRPNLDPLERELDKEHSPCRHELNEAKQIAETLKTRIRALESEKAGLARRLAAVRTTLKPQWESLSLLFSELNGGRQDMGVASIVNREAYTPWLAKAGRPGARKMLEILMERGEATRSQLATLAGVSPKTFPGALSWLNTRGLVEKDGDVVRLKPI